MKNREQFMQLGVDNEMINRVFPAHCNEDDAFIFERQGRNMCEQCPGINECLGHKIYADLQAMFPDNKITFCNSVMHDNYPGWVIGLVNNEKSDINKISLKYPDIRFVVTTFDNYDFFSYFMINGAQTEIS